ncbi:MAG: uroporphyrinogen-III synthase [Rhodospirillaceae bacterium]
MRVLITQPAQVAAISAKALAARGHEPIIIPLVTVERESAPAINLASAQGFLATSPEGVRALAEHVGVRTFPIFVDSELTAAEARRAGFKDVLAAKDDSQDLARLVERSLKPANGALVYACSTAAPVNLGAMLGNMGFAVRPLPLYSIKRVAEIPNELRATLDSEGIDVALFMSPDEARAFVTLIQRDEGAPSITGLKTVTATPAIAAPLRALKGISVTVASASDPDSVWATLDGELIDKVEDERRERERKIKEEEARRRAEEERLQKEKEEHERIARAKADAERIERAKRAEEERTERERLEAERARIAKEEAERAALERLAREEEHRIRAEEERRRKEAAERERAEKLTREKAEKERLAAERAAREDAERERLRKEKEERESLRAEEEARAKIEKERLAAEKAAREQAERERLAAERAERDRLKAEEAARAKAEKERLAAERAAREAAERERLRKEKEERERLRAEEEVRRRLEKERLAAERAAQERLRREREERERAERERIAAEQAAHEKAEREQRAREQAARDEAERVRRAAENAERDRLEGERKERERIERKAREKEHAEKERIAREEAERVRAENARVAAAREKQRLEQERIAREEAARVRAENELLARERAETERADREKRAEAARLEKERLAREKAEHERVKAEQAAQEAERKHLQRGEAAAQKARDEQARREEAAKARAEQEHRAQEQAERRRAEKEEAERAKAERKRIAEERKAQAKAEKTRLAAERTPSGGWFAGLFGKPAASIERAPDPSPDPSPNPKWSMVVSHDPPRTPDPTESLAAVASAAPSWNDAPMTDPVRDTKEPPAAEPAHVPSALQELDELVARESHGAERTPESLADAKPAARGGGGRSAQMQAEDAADERMRDRLANWGRGEPEAPLPHDAEPQAESVPEAAAAQTPARRRGAGRSIALFFLLATIATAAMMTSHRWLPLLVKEPPAPVASAPAPTPPQIKPAPPAATPAPRPPASAAAPIAPAPPPTAAPPVADVSNQTIAALMARVATLEAALGNTVRLEELNRRVDSLAGRSADANSVLALADRVAALEQAGRSAADQRAVAVALTIAATQWRDAVVTGRPFLKEWDTVKALKGQSQTETLFAKYASSGLPTLAEMQRRFDLAAAAAVRAGYLPNDTASWLRQTLDRVFSVISVRRTDVDTGDGVDAILVRAARAADGGNLAGAVAEMKKLTGASLAAATPWIELAEARAAAEEAAQESVIAGATTLAQPTAAPVVPAAPAAPATKTE